MSEDLTKNSAEDKMDVGSSTGPVSTSNVDESEPTLKTDSEAKDTCEDVKDEKKVSDDDLASGDKPDIEVQDKVETSNSKGDCKIENGITDEVADFEEATLNEVERRIIKQILYYFGDINLPRDKFLQEQIVKNEGAWVPISVLMTFKRLAALCTDAQTVATALIKSGEKLLQVNKQRTKLRRNPNIPPPEFNEERKKILMGRTAYVKGFPGDVSLETLIQFFEPHGDVEAVHMRYYIDKAENQPVFKGSVFAVFKEVDICRKFVELDEVKYNDTVLLRKWQADYITDKKQERRSNKDKNTGVQDAKVHKAETQDNDSAKDKDAEVDKQARDEEEESTDAITFPKGCVLHMSGFNKKTTRDTIKKLLAQKGHVPAYIAFQKGDSQAWARFQEKDEAITLLDKLPNGKLKVMGAEITARVLEGEEEQQYFKEAADSMQKKKGRSNPKWKGKKRGTTSIPEGVSRPKRTRR